MDLYLSAALKLINVIKSNGFEAYIVGGYVRDYILNDNPHDIDITTSALPNDIMNMFKKVYPTGIDFEGVTVVFESYTFEVTTYRKDISYYDHRHPKVAYASTLAEDLSRRDFTINAMCLDSNMHIIDLFNGVNDLNNKIIRTVGEADIRFYEDALRMLRAFYFSAKLGFEIEEDTLKGIENNAMYLDSISGERIYAELKKMLNSKYSLNGLNYLSKSKLLNYLPSLKEATILLSNLRISVSFIEYLALGFYLEGTTERYKLSTRETKSIKSIVTLIDMKFDNYTLFSYEYCDLKSANILKQLLNKDYLIDFDLVYNTLPIKNKKDLDFDSNILINMGFKGKEIGKTLDKLYRLVLDKKVSNTKDKLIKALLKEVKNG